MSETITLGVLADTHVPDRQRELPQQTLKIFQQAGVLAILHAGDFSHPRVKHQLEAVAPVFAVQGNRDIWLMRDLPRARILTFNGARIGMTHGHGNLQTYLQDKINLLRHGVPKFSVFEQRVLKSFSDVQAVVFGHIHHPINRRKNGVLLFNPGSTCHAIPHGTPLSVGLLHISPQGEIQGEILPIFPPAL